ncbi:unnamed protein product [Ostreobium quekettii]|uniref:Growth arrest-specific protein 8 domain-containing protein n=1 Tax=Ostreobium quekettii TaxID=121088 RepID=A0A8S1IQY8_9CHLO|nr:unnamed protein product [Ostreobium quekettii]|eukprot:evm.model.scf_210.4 EVM.evm.TU.scf_210.4   scf_210:67474-72133(-)
MGPKKKAKAKGGKKERRDVAPGGDVEAASIEELNQKIATLEKEKNKEEEYRNYMQLERDKINAFWEITKKELEEKKAELRNKDREIEEMEERQQVEIKVYKQKVKHLLYEHQNGIAALKADSEQAPKLQQDDFRNRRAELEGDKRLLKMDGREQELSHEELVRQMKLEQTKEITKLRQEFELQARELQLKYEKKMKLLRDDLDLRRKQEIHEIEERKNTHINDLMKKHDKAFAEIKNYYNDITHNNLDLIKTLKEDVTEMKKKETQNEKLMYEIAHENKRLSDPLTRALKEVESLRQQLANYEKDKASLQHTKARLCNTEKQFKNLEWESEVMRQRFEEVQRERDSLYEKFESSIYTMQQKAGMKSIILEKKVEGMTEEIEKKEAQIGEIIVSSNMNPASVQQINNKLEEVLNSKNRIIKALQYDVAKVSKAHNDLICVYEAKLAEFGIPPEELGFRPLMTNTTTAPAGLVAGS